MQMAKVIEDPLVERVAKEARRNSPYKRGADRERLFAKRLEQEGWSVTRSAGSRSPHDLVASRALMIHDRLKVYSEVMYVQVKCDKLSPWSHFGPVDRALLVETAKKAGATPVLVWWPPHSKPQYFY